MKPPLLLTSNDGTQSGRSGYDVLADYIPDAEVIAIPRSEPKRILSCAIRKLKNRQAVSSWCMPSSWELERAAAQRLKEDFGCVVHLLWGDRDWGTLDRLCEKTGTPLVATVHACPLDLEHVFPARNRHRLKNAASIILMSEHQKPFFLEAGVPEDKLHVILHGVDCDYFHPATEEVDGPFTTIFVGNTRRDFDTLYKTATMLGQQNPAIRLRLICKKEHQEPFKSLGNVDLFSGVSEEELLRHYQESHVLLMPLLDCTANNAVLEALACGLPVVASHVGGITGYVDDTCAILTPHGDAEAMVAAITGLAEEPAKWRKLSLNARERSRQLSWEVQAMKVSALYMSCIGSETNFSKAPTPTFQS